jgi:hypothetical protein
MKLVEIVSADSQLNLARALRRAAMIREIIKKKALGQRKPQLIFATTINKKYGIDLQAREAAAGPRHPKAIHYPKM